MFSLSNSGFSFPGLSCVTVTAFAMVSPRSVMGSAGSILSRAGKTGLLPSQTLLTVFQCTPAIVYGPPYIKI